MASVQLKHSFGLGRSKPFFAVNGRPSQKTQDSKTQKSSKNKLFSQGKKPIHYAGAEIPENYHSTVIQKHLYSNSILFSNIPNKGRKTTKRGGSFSIRPKKLKQENDTLLKNRAKKLAKQKRQGEMPEQVEEILEEIEGSRGSGNNTYTQDSVIQLALSNLDSVLPKVKQEA